MPDPIAPVIEDLRERLHKAISGSWSTMSTCWEAQTSAVLAALPVEDDMDLRELVGPMLDAAQVRDADGVAALVVDVISPALGRLRNRITALEANGAELWRSLDIADERIERVRAQHRQDDPEDPMCRHCRMTWPCPTIRILDAPEGNAPAPSPVTAEGNGS